MEAKKVKSTWKLSSFVTTGKRGELILLVDLKIMSNKKLFHRSFKG